MGYSPKFTLKKNKNKKNKIMAGNMEKAGREYNCNFEGNLPILVDFVGGIVNIFT